MFVDIYMNSTTPKRHAETLRNWNIQFQLKKKNTYWNGIDNLGGEPLFLGWINADPIQKKNSKKFLLLKKNCNISVYFSTKFCLILVRIFIQ